MGPRNNTPPGRFVDTMQLIAPPTGGEAEPKHRPNFPHSRPVPAFLIVSHISVAEYHAIVAVLR
jgi:hypothetical protein